MTVQLHLTMKKGKMPLRGEDYLWSLMMERHEAGNTFTVAEIHRLSATTVQTVREFMERLSRGGFIEPVATPPVQSWRVAKPQAETPRVRKDGSLIESAGVVQCLWNGMRSHFKLGFNVVDLAVFCSTDDVKIAIASAEAYVRHLAKAGYLIKLQTGSKGTAIWRLDPAMNTGPAAPMLLKTKVVFDPNKGDIIGAAEAEEVLA